MEGRIQVKKERPTQQEELPRPIPKDWWEGEDPVGLTLTANAGILVSYGGEKLLLDGLHNSSLHDFSPVPRYLLDRIEHGEGAYGGIRWLLYTHLHIDHFSGEETLGFLQSNPVKKLFLPAGNGGPGIDEGINPLRVWLTAHKTPVQELHLPEGQPACWTLTPEIKVIAIRAIHAAAEYEEIEHYCFLLELGGRTVLFLGDSDYDKDYFAFVLSGRKVDVAVVNPLFISKPAGRAVLLEGVHAQRVVVNHIPFSQDDAMGMRRMVRRVLERHEQELPPTAVLWDPEDSITL